MNPKHLRPVRTSGGPFNLKHALKNWREKIPDKGERIAFFQSELEDCREQRNVRARSNTITRHHPVTAACLEAMLGAEGVPYV